MNSNNLDEKLLLAFAIDSFKHWGIQCVTEETLKKAKKNDPSVSRSMANLLFDLCILHMFSYRWKPEQLTIRFHSQ